LSYFLTPKGLIMNRFPKNFISLILLFLLGFVSLNHAEENNSPIVNMKNFLITGPMQVKTPALIEMKSDEIESKEVLEYQYKRIKDWWPKEDDKFEWDRNKNLKWQTYELSDENEIFFEPDNVKNFQLYYLANYLNVKSFFNGKLKLNGFHLFEVYVDGNKICSKTTSDSEKPKEENFVTGSLALEPGKHLLIIKSLYDPKSTLPWQLKIKLEADKEFDKNIFSTNTDPERRMTLEHLLDIPEIKGVSISSDGKYAAISFRQIKDDGKSFNYWIDILDTKYGKSLFPQKVGENISNLKWVPKSSRLSFITTEEKKSTIWLFDLNNGSTKSILENIENLSDYNWSPDASFTIYSITEKPKEDKEGLKKLQGMPDRWPTWRDKDELYLLDVMTGTKRQLIKSNNSSTLYDIHPQNDKILFAQSKADNKNRPYFKSFLYILNLNSMQFDSIWSGYWLGSASFSPDGKKLLMTGGPSFFDGIGKSISEDKIPNDYDTQAYIFDLDSKKINAITKNFNPSIDSKYWLKNNIYFTVTDKSKKLLYKYDVNSGKYSLIETGLEAIDNVALADDAPYAVYYGSSATQPHAVYFLDLQTEKYKLLVDPSKEAYKHTKLSTVKRWTFKNKQGVEIEGRVYYPPHFNPDKKYPCIVNYYGGVSPVERDFGGRYPKNYYSVHDYIVYVLQPSGCVGFGQEFSAVHVNDWGKVVAEEIIDGVGQFLDAHPFVDRKKVGCIGASYGGFMTMLLLTKTDIFAAGISHAGISDISGYWGEGFWGYLYNARSAANSFPWNRKDIYVDQSPLFGSENINTPLLLLHGDADTNVPPGESRQLYTALKLLGKEVDLIEISDQNHWIREHNKRKKWTKTIVAWFDKWLKGDDGWWKELYSE
jgi:dipeptidyl aminopeptidase/acylaminoacyl peptidase